MRRVAITDLSGSVQVRQDEIDDFIEGHRTVVVKKARAENRSLDDVAASLVAAQKVSDAFHEIDGRHGSLSVETDTV